MDNSIPVIEGDLTPITDETLNYVFGSLFRKARIYYIILFPVITVMCGMLAVYDFMKGYTATAVLYIVIGVIFVLFCAKTLILDIPKKIKACVSQFRKNHPGPEHYVYYPDRRVMSDSENSATVRYDEVFKAKELHDCWLFYMGEKNAWDLLYCAKECFSEPGHYEKAVELLLSNVPEKNIKRLK